DDGEAQPDIRSRARQQEADSNEKHRQIRGQPAEEEVDPEIACRIGQLEHIDRRAKLLNNQRDRNQRCDDPQRGYPEASHNSPAAPPPGPTASHSDAACRLRVGIVMRKTARHHPAAAPSERDGGEEEGRRNSGSSTSCNCRGPGSRAASCASIRMRSTRSNWLTGSATTMPGRSSTISSKSIRTRRPRKCSSPPRRSERNASA